MASKLLRSGLITAALAAAPGIAMAQSAAPTVPATAAPAAAEAAPPTEAEQLQAQITRAQQAAAQNAEVQAANAAIIAAMEAADPEFRALSERARTIRTDIAAAQAAADNAKLRELAAETQQLNANIATARTRASANAEVQAKTTAYRTILLQTMVQIDPDVQKAITRLNELRS